MNNHIVEKILCVRELRYNAGRLEQKLLISKTYPNGLTGEVEEWRSVSGLVRGTKPETVEFWSSVDWSKSNAELIPELQLNSSTISTNRKKYGYRPQPKPLRKHDWSSTDWSKNNQEIARETGRTIAVVADARNLLGIPQAERKPNGNQIVSNEQLESADWVWKTDMDLSKEFGVSRERVRQLRLELKKPVCLVKHHPQVNRDSLRWLIENRATIEGKNIYDVCKMMPGDQRRTAKINLIKRLGFKFDWSRKHWKWGPQSETPMNFDLPNKWLTLIWKQKFNVVGARRSMHIAGRPKWFAGGFSTNYLSNPEFLSAVTAEVAKAQAAGVIVTEQEILDAIEVKKAKKYSRREPPAGAGGVLEGGVGLEGQNSPLTGCGGVP